MKKFTALLLSLCLLLMPGLSLAMGFQLPTLTLPADSTVFSPSFAAQALSLCLADQQKLALLGLTPIFQAHYDKDAADAAHTSAYTVYEGVVQHGGAARPLVAIVIRATVGGEWYSNFDFAPSRDPETQYAENFYAAAADIYTSAKALLAGKEQPLILVTGYSRGAACANLLGMMLNQDYPVQDVYVYAAAGPNTVRGEAAKVECPNVFTIVNPGDLITHLPLSAWGYTRLGQDIVLPADAAVAQQTQAAAAALATVVPDITAYYTTRHSLTGPGESAFGLTAYEVMQSLAAKLMGTADSTTAAALSMLSPTSNLAPLAALFTRAADDPADLATQHDPNTYTQLFTQMQMALLMGK